MSHINIRVFNEKGIGRFRKYLDALRDGAILRKSETRTLLTDNTVSEPTPVVLQVDQGRVFGRRFDLAEHLNGLVPRLGVKDPVNNTGLWAWMALLWLDQIVPPAKADGIRTIGEDYRYIPDYSNHRTYYRHRLLGPYMIYSAHRDDPRRALCMLCQPPWVHPDTAEQIASRQALIQSTALVGAATHLYYDSKRGALRPGSVHNRRPFMPGTLRRLIDIFWQLDLTYDLYACTTEAFLSLLPKEFQRFHEQTS